MTGVPKQIVVYEIREDIFANMLIDVAAGRPCQFHVCDFPPDGKIVMIEKSPLPMSPIRVFVETAKCKERGHWELGMILPVEMVHTPKSVQLLEKHKTCPWRPR